MGHTANQCATAASLGRAFDLDNAPVFQDGQTKIAVLVSLIQQFAITTPYAYLPTAAAPRGRAFVTVVITGQASVLCQVKKQ